MATAVITNKTKRKLKAINAITYGAVKISKPSPVIRINEVLPFRVRITNIQVPGYSATNPAAIGVAIIGLNNYIL
jgi:hypothetical protein